MAQMEALRNGYDTTIILNDQGKVAEGPGSCFFLVKDGKLVTPQVTDSVLESITRATVIQLAKELGIEVEIRTVDRTELYTCDEAFLCGSAMEITPIWSVDGYHISEGDNAPITDLIHMEYLSIATGNKGHNDWLTPIYSE